MHREKIEKFLTEKGYRRQGKNGFDSESVVSNYYKTHYDARDIPFCLTNDKPPQIAVKEWLHRDGLRGYEIAISNEAPQGWIDFKFYSITEKELIERFSEMETALLSVCRHLFALKAQ
jgi:hypothetical protein